MADNSRRIETVDALRGVAALLVMWFHFNNGNELSATSWLKISGSYGWLGLDIFFVISGFIIPYSMQRANYEWRNFGGFITKRIVRLDPPYIVAVLLSLALLKLSAVMPGFHGHPLEFSWGQFWSHFGYLNDLVGYSWYAHVFWTLAIEFQWYLAMALVFPLLARGGGAHFDFRRVSSAGVAV